MKALWSMMVLLVLLTGMSPAQEQPGRIRRLPRVNRPLAPPTNPPDGVEDAVEGELPEVPVLPVDLEESRAEELVRDLDREMEAREAAEILDAHTPDSFERWAIVAIVGGGALLAFIVWVGRMLRGARLG